MKYLILIIFISSNSQGFGQKSSKLTTNNKNVILFNQVKEITQVYFDKLDTSSISNKIYSYQKYDIYGNLIENKPSFVNDTFAPNLLRYKYDIRGNKTESLMISYVSEIVNDSKNGKILSFGYKLNNPILDTLISRSTYEYDALNNLTNETYYNYTGKIKYSKKYKNIYRKNLKIEKIELLKSKTKYYYNPEGSIIKEEYYVYQPHKKKFKIEYKILNNYYKNQVLKEQIIKSFYSPKGRNVFMGKAIISYNSNGNYTKAIEYDKKNNLIGTSLDYEYTYDKSNLIQQVNLLNFNGVIQSTIKYEYKFFK